MHLYSLFADPNKTASANTSLIFVKSSSVLYLKNDALACRKCIKPLSHHCFFPRSLSLLYFCNVPHNMKSPHFVSSNLVPESPRIGRNPERDPDKKIGFLL